MTDAAIAVIDIDPFIKGDAADRQKAAAALGEAFETTGFAVIVGHGVPESLVQDTYDALVEFFALPFADKEQFTPPEQAKGRGYLPIGIESVAKTLTGETPPDLCEALVFGALHRELKGIVGKPNIWPDHPPSLKPLIAEYCDHMVAMTGHLATMSAMALDLDEEYFDPFFADPALTLRFVNYPDQIEPPAPGQLRYGEHHDYGALTILRQDTAPGGLEIWQDDEWRDAGRVPESFIINVGDLMSRWTNGRWRSTLHRVTNPPRDLTGSTQRLSLVAFAGPNEGMEVACLPTCQSEENPPKYEPVLAGQYIRDKIAASMELSSTN
ncbi:isopenicillin N synthase family dioxygenase [Bauldia sp.]|uniref:isopenicillin N synthase family dioxygenase n=1 Tax=Bauldia sp. TaxID=2575872 RepID=UPI003BAD7DD7